MSLKNLRVAYVSISFASLLLFFLSFNIPTNAQTQPIKAFPGAEGFGAQAKGGRGGKVIEVTNLNDSGPGSLRDCAQASGPRICVFRVGGTITLQSDIDIVNPFITIAGQTAPGGGITLKAPNPNSAVHVQIRTYEVIIRYIRSRPGTRITNSRALSINNGAATMDAAARNIVIDHNSFSWTGDEMTIAWKATNNISYQWNIVAESLPSTTEVGIKGPSFGEDEGGFYSVHHNLIAHHTQRLPQVSARVGPVDIVNNVIYNPGGLGSTVKNGTHVNYVKNYIKAGPNTHVSAYIHDGGVKGPAAGYYVEGNFLDGIAKLNTAVNEVPTRFSAPTITTTTPQTAYDHVLEQAGAAKGLNCDGTWFNRRDSVDTRIVQSVIDGTTGHTIPLAQTFQGLGYISNPSDVGGWPVLATGTACTDTDHDGMPDVWETAQALNPNQNDSVSDKDSNGYTNIEEYLNGSTSTSPPTITATPTVSLSPSSPPPPICITKKNGDANCKKELSNGVLKDVTLVDFEIWRSEKFALCSQTTLSVCGADEDADGSLMDADFNGIPEPSYNNALGVSIADFELWRKNFY